MNVGFGAIMICAT